MTALTGHALSLATVQRPACWGDWSTWTGREYAGGMPMETGPIIELELGTRAASALLCPDQEN